MRWRYSPNLLVGAAALGGPHGAAELIFEKFSVDRLLSPKEISGFKSWVVEALKQGGVEATEEMATEIANIMFDAAIMGEKSEFNQMVQHYMTNEGLGREAATEKAYMDMIDRVVLAGIGGLVSGEVMGGAFNAAQYRPAQTNGKNNTAATGMQGAPKIKMADFVDINSSVWTNIAYEDIRTQLSIMQNMHQEMVEAGEIVSIPSKTMEQVGQSYPDLRDVKKSERTPILRQKMNELKTSLRQFLNGLKGGTYEFEVNGNILETRLYDTGVREVMEKVTQEKASMLYHSEDVFRNARYLYSTPDYDGNPNIYRWNYFYTPVQLGNETVGVRIAVRDMAEGTNNHPESQIYNWGIKKDAVLGGGRPGVSTPSSDASSTTSNNATLDGEGRGQNRISPDVSSVASKDDGTIPSTGRHATSIKSGGSPSSVTIIPQTGSPSNTPSQADIDSIVQQLTEAQHRSQEAAIEQMAAQLRGVRKEEIDPFLVGFYADSRQGQGNPAETGAEAADKEFHKVLETAANGGKIILSEEMENVIAGKPFSELQLLRGKLSDRATRKWYLAQDAQIPSLIDRSRSIEEQARKACELRNQNRTNARDLMEDQEARRRLDLTDPNKSFDELIVSKMIDKKLTREQAVEDILRTATKTRKSVNQKYGLE